MMKANYHTHTWRCNHAEPDERAYVQAALDTGLKVLGFSDHSPYPFDDGYCSGFRMRCDQTAEYIRTIAALRDECRGDIWDSTFWAMSWTASQTLRRRMTPRACANTQTSAWRR